jgi:hypothetical protein
MYFNTIEVSRKSVFRSLPELINNLGNLLCFQGSGGNKWAWAFVGHRLTFWLDG